MKNFNEKELVEKELLDYLPKILHSESVFIDVNADQGQWVLCVGKTISKGIIYAIEPDPTKFNDLKTSCLQWQTLFENNVSIYPLPIVISNKDSETESSTVNSSTRVQDEPRQTPAETNVTLFKLDTLFKSTSPNFIKIVALEGNEVEILKGATSILKSGKARFLIRVDEYHNFDSKTNIVDLLNFMSSFGYYPQKISGWYLFTNRKKLLLHYLKKLTRQWL